MKSWNKILLQNRLSARQATRYYARSYTARLRAGRKNEKSCWVFQFFPLHCLPPTGRLIATHKAEQLERQQPMGTQRSIGMRKAGRSGRQRSVATPRPTVTRRGGRRRPHGDPETPPPTAMPDHFYVVSNRVEVKRIFRFYRNMDDRFPGLKQCGFGAFCFGFVLGNSLNPVEISDHVKHPRTFNKTGFVGIKYAPSVMSPATSSLAGKLFITDIGIANNRAGIIAQ